jgi:uracil-DNA glycosylase family 4
MLIGEGPSFEEDRQDRNFVGPSGIYLETVYLKGAKFDRYADVYIGNVTRCYGGRQKPNKGHRIACRPYLLEDLQRLHKAYNGNLTILCLGSLASQGVVNQTSNVAFRNQGQRLDPETWPDLESVRVFNTYHPGFLLPDRNPTAVHSIRDHLVLLLDYLRGHELISNPTPPTLAEIEVAPMAPRHNEHVPALLSLDIETYGMTRDTPVQTVFHPRKSVYWDKVRTVDLIQTVALTWRTEVDNLRMGIFVWSQELHRARLLRWLHAMHRTRGMIIGMNIVFDLSYLRYVWPRVRYLLDPHRARIRLWDLAITSYLHNEMRPEKSLKSLAPLFGFASYDKEKIGTYNGAWDPELWIYNVTDTWATLLLHEYLIERIRRDYPDTKKLSPRCLRWYNRLIWMALDLSETGIAFDRARLEELLIKAHRNLGITSEAAQLLDCEAILAGTGAGKWIQSLVDIIYDKLPAHRQREMETTATMNYVSTGAHNLHLLQNWLPSDSTERRLVDLKLEHRASQKLASTYLKPMLIGRVKGNKPTDHKPTLIPMFTPNGTVEVAFPSWYIVPQTMKADPEERSGGTEQGRIIPRNPALQTDPAPIRNCVCSRFGDDGMIVVADLSQIELRVPAILSGDPVLIHAHENGIDLHTDMAKTAFGDEIESNPDFKKLFRQAAKGANFGCQYRGGGETIHAEMIRKFGQDIPLPLIERCIQTFWLRHTRLRAWQDQLIEHVGRTGYLELPLLGQSRRYPLGQASLEHLTPTICNQPIQTEAANIMISAQDSIGRDLRHHRLRTVICLQVYDSIYLDVYKPELETVREIVGRWMTNPPYYVELCEFHGRTVPLDYDFEIKGAPS